MQVPPNHPLELLRLEELRTIGLLDSPLSPQMERITRLAALSLGVPICAVSLIDEHHLWFCSIQGLDISEIDRSVSFCGHAILTPDIMEISDMLRDPRFADNPMVVGEPHIRFYAGRPLLGPGELPMGTLCVIDHRPRTLSERERGVLEELGAMAQAEICRIQSGGGDLIARSLPKRCDASHDPTTRLCDRRAMLRVLAGALHAPEHAGRPVVCAVLRIDDYGSLCDEYGGEVIDATLCNTARNALAACHENELIGHLDDGAFLAVITPIVSTSAVADAVERLRAKLASVPVNAGDTPRTIRVSAGAALGVIGSCTVSDLLLNAEHALAETSEQHPVRVLDCGRRAA